MLLRHENEKDYVPLKVPGFQVGGYTDLELHSGMTLFLVERPNTAGVFVSGSAPATHETDLLRSPNRRDYAIDALLFTGRSAYGFNSIPKLMDWLRRNKRGFVLNEVVVPIIPAVAIFDFNENDQPPRDDWVEKAIRNLGDKIPIGPFWAGTGATVGKYKGKKIFSGQGYAVMEKGDLRVGVFVVLNSLGDVFGFDGTNISDPNGKNLKETISSFPFDTFSKLGDLPNIRNTTIGAVITNASLTNTTASYVAYQANLGFASRIWPYSTSLDGDTVFCVSNNKIQASPDVVAIMARAAAELAVLSVFKK